MACRFRESLGFSVTRTRVLSVTRADGGLASRPGIFGFRADLISHSMTAAGQELRFGKISAQRRLARPASIRSIDRNRLAGGRWMRSSWPAGPLTPWKPGAKDQERRRDERGTIEEEDGMLCRH